MSAALVGDTKVTPFTAYELQWTFNQDGAPGAFTGSGPHTAVTSPIYVEFYEAATEYGAPATDEWWVGASGTVSYDPHSRSGTLSAVLVPEQGSDFDGTNAASGTATVSATWKCPPS